MSPRVSSATRFSPEGEPRSPIVDAGLCICTTGLGQRVRAVSALMGCARSERPTRRLCRSNETRAPDERDPLKARQASGGGWRESSKRSSASVGAGAPSRGRAITRVAGGARLLAVESDRADVVDRTLETGRRHERAKCEGRTRPDAWFLGKQERRARLSSRPSRVTRQRVLPRESTREVGCTWTRLVPMQPSPAGAGGKNSPAAAMRSFRRTIRGASMCPIPAVRPPAAALLLCCLRDSIAWLAPGALRSRWRARGRFARFPRVAGMCADRQEARRESKAGTPRGWPISCSGSHWERGSDANVGENEGPFPTAGLTWLDLCGRDSPFHHPTIDDRSRRLSDAVYALRPALPTRSRDGEISVIACGELR